MEHTVCQKYKYSHSIAVRLLGLQAILSLQSSSEDYISDFRYVVLISGLELSSSVDSLLSLELLIDYLSGHLGHSEEQAAVANISRVVIAGMYFYYVCKLLQVFFTFHRYTYSFPNEIHKLVHL